MGRKKGYNLIGKEFGKLKVVKDTGKRTEKRGKVWLCLCSCGNYKEATTTHLMVGDVRSCGCLRKETSKSLTDPKMLDYLRTYTPKELENVPSKIMEGQFRVFANGRIFKISRRKVKECNINVLNGYKAITGKDENGKLTHFYVHKLLAEAFIPNPKNKPMVFFKDGNKANVTLENLGWATHKEFRKKLLNEGKIDFYEKCCHCGGNTTTVERICSKCKQRIVRKHKKERTKQKRIDRVSDIRFDVLTQRQKQVVELALQGKTHYEIAEILNVTRQAVSETIRRAKLRSERFKKFEKEILIEK